MVRAQRAPGASWFTHPSPTVRPGAGTMSVQAACIADDASAGRTSDGPGDDEGSIACKDDAEWRGW